MARLLTVWTYSRLSSRLRTNLQRIFLPPAPECAKTRVGRKRRGMAEIAGGRQAGGNGCRWCIQLKSHPYHFPQCPSVWYHISRTPSPGLSRPAAWPYRALARRLPASASTRLGCGRHAWFLSFYRRFKERGRGREGGKDGQIRRVRLRRSVVPLPCLSGCGWCEMFVWMMGLDGWWRARLGICLIRSTGGLVTNGGLCGHVSAGPRALGEWERLIVIIPGKPFRKRRFELHDRPDMAY